MAGASCSVDELESALDPELFGCVQPGAIRRVAAITATGRNVFTESRANCFKLGSLKKFALSLIFFLSRGDLASVHALTAASSGQRAVSRRLHSCVAVSRRERQSAQQVASAKGTG